MINLQNVVKTFGDGTSSPKVALDGLSVVVRPGERVAVLGPNGSGKTTLVRLIATEIVPDSGMISFNGAARLKTGYVTQDVNASIFPGLTFLEHLFVASSTGPVLRSTVVTELKKRIQYLCPILSARFKDYPETFSGGEKQLVAVSLALLSEPDVILLDEPTSSLDTINYIHFWEILQRYLNQHPRCILVLVTHNMAEVAQIATRAVVLREGKIIEEMQAMAGGLDIKALSSKLWPEIPEIGTVHD